MKPIVKIPLITGGILCLAPLIGLVGTVISMIATFDEIATSGTADSEQLADGVETSFLLTWVGLGIAGVGLLFLLFGLVALLVTRNDERPEA